MNTISTKPNGDVSVAYGTRALAAERARAKADPHVACPPSPVCMRVTVSTVRSFLASSQTVDLQTLLGNT